MRPGPKYKAEERIIELRRSGLKVADVAEQAGVSQSTVLRCLRRHGMSGQRVDSKRERKRKPPSTVDPAFTLVEIGDRVGIKVLPTSEAQYERLLAALRELGGEVI
jgi:transposase-like protein